MYERIGRLRTRDATHAPGCVFEGVLYVHAWGRELCEAVRPPSRRPSFVLAEFFISAVINVKQSTLACSGGAQGRQGETHETKGLTFTGRRGQTGNEEL